MLRTEHRAFNASFVTHKCVGTKFTACVHADMQFHVRLNLQFVDEGRRFAVTCLLADWDRRLPKGFPELPEKVSAISSSFDFHGLFRSSLLRAAS
jgi:hypothetical protein